MWWRGEVVVEGGIHCGTDSGGGGDNVEAGNANSEPSKEGTYIHAGLGGRLERPLVNLELVHTVAEDALEQGHHPRLLAGPGRPVDEHVGHVARLGDGGELLRERIVVVELGQVLRAVLVHPQRHGPLCGGNRTISKFKVLNDTYEDS